HSVSLNYIQSDDAVFFSCTPEPEDFQSHDDSFIIPKDPLYFRQWHLSKDEGVNIPQAWAISTGSPHVTIGIVDRNFSFTDPDLNPDFCPSRNFYYQDISAFFPSKKLKKKNEEQQHGLDVLSVLAPCTNNDFGLSGIDWQAQIFLVDSKNNRSLSARLLGIMWAAGIDLCSSSIIDCPQESSIAKNIYPADVINASFGFTGPYLKDPPYGPVLDIIGTINKEKRILVASVGNEQGFADMRLPGAAGGVISVGSSNENRRASSFNNFGTTVDVLAPGENIFGMHDEQAFSYNGTSFAAPIVSGIVSLMLSVNPELSWKHVEYILKTTASPLSCDDYCQSDQKKSHAKCMNLCCQNDHLVCGAGIVDAKKAVAMAQKGIPKTALIDFDDYYLPLSFMDDLKMKVLVKNWGGVPALVRMKKTDPHLKIYPKQFSLPPYKDGIPGSKEITVHYDNKSQKSLVVNLILEAASKNNPGQYKDQIEAIVEIVPDEQQ
ncbi:MAG: S8 family serine peptidase, partial [Myxococcales bacterium]|nr:S8 family serine peptidase [Myxococcales bacterium]